MLERARARFISLGYLKLIVTLTRDLWPGYSDIFDKSIKQARTCHQAPVTSMRKRASPVAADRETQELKRVKSALDESANHLVCAISMALPVDPVTAMDGHVYERSAILEWIAVGNGKSPRTNVPMGTTLLAAPHAKSMIEHMVKSGVLTGDKADAWQVCEFRLHCCL